MLLGKSLKILHNTNRKVLNLSVIVKLQEEWLIV
jgi:hypothetical protein